MKLIRLICVGTSALLLACNNYGLLDKLQDPDQSSSTKSCGTNCRIFVSGNTYPANMGGPTGADNFCLFDPANPAGQGKGLWKALLSATPLRTACVTSDCSGGIAENFNWVLKPNAVYRRGDNTQVGTTNANAIFNFPLSNPIGSAGAFAWTGMTATWQSSSNCVGWTDATTGLGGQGDASATSTAAIFTSNGSCPGSGYLYCAEQ
jgi:hypothetical protein